LYGFITPLLVLQQPILYSFMIKRKRLIIVKSTNIKDVNFSKNTVTLLLRGKPEIYDDPIILKKKVNGLNIKVDTTAVSTGPTFRKFYKRNNEGKLY